MGIKDKKSIYGLMKKAEISDEAAEWIYPWVCCSIIMTDQNVAVGLTYNHEKQSMIIREKIEKNGIWICMAAASYGVCIIVDNSLAQEMFGEYELHEQIKGEHYDVIIALLIQTANNGSK